MLASGQQSFLVLGGSGHLGRHLYRLLGAKRAIATFNSFPFPGGVHFDAMRMRLADTLLRGSHTFTAAFVLYGNTRIEECARAPEATARLNVDSVIRVIDELVSAGIKPIYASSDAVLDGTKGHWTEEDPPNPILTYGTQKVAVERYLQEQAQPWVIARLSKLVGNGSVAHDVLGEWIRQIENDEVIYCATDLFFSPIYVVDAASALIKLAEPSLSGIYNVCGPRSMSRLELLEILLMEVRRYRQVQPRVTACSIRDFAFLEPRPLNCSMSSAKLRGLRNIRLRDMESVCADLARKRYGVSPRQGRRSSSQPHGD